MKKLHVKVSLLAVMVFAFAVASSVNARAAGYSVIANGEIAGQITDVNTYDQSITVNTITVYCIPFTNLLNEYNYVPKVGDAVTVWYELRLLPDQTQKYVATALAYQNVTYTFNRTK